jgi:NAD(P)H-quinone oxidoreductase subunit 5
LSSGSIVQQWRASHIVHHPRLRIWHLMAATILVCIPAAPFYMDTAIPVDGFPPAIGPLVLVLGLSFAPMIGRAIAAGRRAFVIAALFAVGASAAYVGWHVIFELLAPGIDAGMEASATKWTIVVTGLVVLYLAQSLLQTRPNGWFSRWLQPHLVSGLYIDDWFTRVTFRLWPPGFR